MVRGGTLTLVVALLALSWLNSPWGYTWLYLWENPLQLSFGTYSLSRPLGFWVEQVLFAVVFLVLGMELKRALRVGELKERPAMVLVLAAALGGLAIPAALYLFMVPATARAGWSIVATADVATLLALLALASALLPLALRVFISATAILQSIATLLLSTALHGAVQDMLALSVATGIFGVLVVLRALRNRSMWLYLLLGLSLLVCLLLAGLLGALAGVLLALLIPVYARVDEASFVSTTDTVMGQLHALRMMKRPEPDEDIEEDFQAAVHTLRTNCQKALSPIRRLQQRLLPWAVYLVLPLFALAFVPFAYNSFAWRDLLGPVPLGIGIALVLGKPIGLLLFAWLACVLKVARLPTGVRWPQVMGAAMLTGGALLFSLFQTQQVFADAAEITLVKIAIYVASAISALLGLLVLAFVPKTKDLPPPQV